MLWCEDDEMYVISYYTGRGAGNHKAFYWERHDLQGYHRLNNKPALMYLDGYAAWYVNGFRHRTDGPALIYENGTEFYFLNDEEYSKEAFDDLVRE